MTKKHILIYSQYFHPEQFRINDIAKALVARNYKVSVVTGIPNYPQGKFYEGYTGKDKRFEQWNGIDIYRIPIVARGTNNIKLVMNYFSFMMNARFNERKLPQDADIVFTYEVSPMTQALPAVWYAKRHKVKHYLYVMDLWPENITAITNIKSDAVIKPIEKMVDYIYRNTDKILTSSRSFVESIKARNVPANKLMFWPQYAEELYSVKDRNNTEVEVEQFTERSFVFAGNVGAAQGLDILPKVAKVLKTEQKLVKFVIIGDGRAKEALIDQIKANDVVEYFYFIPRKPADSIPYYLAKFDVGLITLAPNEIFAQTIPAKVQSLMASGMPLLVSADGEVQDVVAQARAGHSSDAGDVAGMVANVKKMFDLTDNELAELKQASRTYYEHHFEKEKMLDQLEELFMNDNV